MNIDRELQQVSLSALQSPEKLKESIKELCEHFDVKSEVPTGIDISTEIQTILLDVQLNNNLEVKNNRVKKVLEKALLVREVFPVEKTEVLPEKQ